VTPMIMGVITSFTDARFGDPVGSFIGFGNYIRLFQDDLFLKSALNTVIIVVVAVPTVTAFSLWVSSAIYQMRSALRSFFRCVFYLPVVTGSVAVVVVWKWMFDKYDGLFNYIIKAFGGQALPWTAGESMALGCIILILFTTSIGQPIVLYVAALGNVDQSLVEASKIDGATDQQVFWRIKWPSIMPTTLYIAVITTINSFQCFALIQLLTSGGPNYSTSTVMYLLYEIAFKTTKEFGYADAMGVVLAIVIALFSAVQFKVMNGGTTE
ncbi:MAG: sugar ABC transporter permease, partial [Pygmaiobacter sp.]